MSIEEAEALEGINIQAETEKQSFQVLKRAVLMFFQHPSSPNAKTVTEKMQVYQTSWMAGRIRP